MILPDHEIAKLAEAGMVDPFDPSLVNPASIDLRLGDTMRRPTPGWHNSAKLLASAMITTEEDTEYWGDEEVFDETWVVSGEFVLCHSLEVVCIPYGYCATLYSKSSTGRIGLEHLHAGYGDPGFHGQWTWEFKNVAPWPIKLKAGQPLMQMTLTRLTSPPEVSYEHTGRYQNQRGPTPAR